MEGFGKKKSTCAELNDDFIDRERERHYFRKLLLDEKFSRLLLIYSGVGSVGKTSLLEQFEKILVNEFYKKFMFVRYNFDSNEFTQADDIFVMLKTL